MTTQFSENLLQSLTNSGLARPMGSVSGVRGTLVYIKGDIVPHARMGQDVSLLSDMHRSTGKVVDIKEENISVQLLAADRTIGIGARAVLENRPSVFPSSAWLAHSVNARAEAMDGAPLQWGTEAVDLEQPYGKKPIPFAFDTQIETGFSVFNTVLPIALGQRVGIFSGPGVGKTTLLRGLLSEIKTDVIILCLVGERQREVEEWRAALSSHQREKTLIVASYSNASAYDRRQAAFTAMSLAEYFCDQGQQVLYLCDSVTRMAEAHREMSAELGELPVMRGYPASLVPKLTSLTERVGVRRSGGSITALFSVLVAGADMDEPVADIMRGILDGHVVLSSEIAARGVYPAIDILRSLSRSAQSVLDKSQNDLVMELRRILSIYEENKMMVQSGLYVAGRDPELDRAIKIAPKIESFATRLDGQSVKMHFDALYEILQT